MSVDPAGLRGRPGTLLKERLKAGAPVIGTWLMGSRSPSFVRLIASVGFDFVLIDTQHVAINDETLSDLCDAAEACELAAIVRLHSASASTVNRVLDLGAAGVMCPDCRSAASVMEAMNGMRFPPNGRRSAMGIHPGLGFATATTRDDLSRLEVSALLVVQIESREGLQHIEEILDTGGVDVLDVGRGDLAIDLAGLGPSSEQVVGDAVEQAIAAARSRQVSVGTTCNSSDEAQRFLAAGVHFISYSSDRRILADAYRSGLQQIKRSIPIN